MSKRIELDAPNVSDNEKEYLDNCINSGFVSTFGPFVSEFEDKFARFIGAPKAVSTQSGTTALHMALYELGIGKGDEVIVPALTFVATVNPVMYVGATPVVVDVDSRTWNIDPGRIEKHISEKTKAIIPVHLYGNPCDMEAILNIARRHSLYVIEDATESLGARYKENYTGTLGDFGCFSFNGNKVITTGGGGMIVGKDEKRLEHIKFLSNQARGELDGAYYHPEVGFNYRMTNIEAALGLAQLDKLDVFLAKKRRFHAIYTEELKECGDIRFQKPYAEAEGLYWLTCVVFGADVDILSLQKGLKEKGVATRRIFMPIVEFPPYRGFRRDDYRNSYEIYEKGLCLPGSTLNSEDDIRYVCRVITELIQKRR